MFQVQITVQLQTSQVKHVFQYNSIYFKIFLEL